MAKSDPVQTNAKPADSLDRVRAARLRLEAARDELHSAIIEAADLGCTQREIGAAASVSQPEVWRVIHRNKRIS